MSILTKMLVYLLHFLAQISPILDAVMDTKRCSNELRDLADYVRYSIDHCPSGSSFYQVYGSDLDVILQDLAMRLDDNLHDCPCAGPCQVCE